MIKSFKGQATQRIWNRERSRKLPGELQERFLRKLQQLHAAESLRDLSIPLSNQLESLGGDRKGQYSIRVNRQWRICFKWSAGHVSDVEIADYH